MGHERDQRANRGPGMTAQRLISAARRLEQAVRRLEVAMPNRPPATAEPGPPPTADDQEVAQRLDRAIARLEGLIASDEAGTAANGGV